MNQVRCFHPDELASTAACAWPAGVDASWYLDPGSVPAIAAPFVEASLTAATAIWAQSAGIRTPRVSDPNTARVLIRFTEIDGPWNVLGITQLPCGADGSSQVLMRLDVAEAWTADMLAQVAAHEFGHALGLGHAPAPTVALMAPIWNSRVYVLQPWDLVQVQGLYGPAPSLQQ